MNDPHWIEATFVMLSDLTSGWAGKISIGATIAFACEMFHVDYGLAIMCFCMLTADMVLRMIDLAKRPKNLAKGLKKAIPRYIFYMLFIVMAWSVEFSVMRALHIDIPFVDIVVAYLILTDCASVIEHFVHLGVPVPKLICMAVLGSREKLEKTTRQILDIEDENQWKDFPDKPKRKRKWNHAERKDTSDTGDPKQLPETEVQETEGERSTPEERDT
ncbi:MAG: phage holin family protein [Desulfovibrio sp.]|nr:phage holin family protein [Desulfovibrio sp.]